MCPCGCKLAQSSPLACLLALVSVHSLVMETSKSHGLLTNWTLWMVSFLYFIAPWRWPFARLRGTTSLPLFP